MLCSDDRDFTEKNLLRRIGFVVGVKKVIKYGHLVEFDQTDESEHDILIDETVKFEGGPPSRRYPHPICRVTVNDHKTIEEPIEPLTNNARWDVATAAAPYKARWQIEICFKMIRQSLRIKSFIAASENAVRTQIRTAMIAILMLQSIKTKAI